MSISEHNSEPQTGSLQAALASRVHTDVFVKYGEATFIGCYSYRVYASADNSMRHNSSGVYNSAASAPDHDDVCSHKKPHRGFGDEG